MRRDHDKWCYEVFSGYQPLDTSLYSVTGRATGISGVESVKSATTVLMG